MSKRPADLDEELHVLAPDGGYIGCFPFDQAVECAAETSCYAMDSSGMRIVFRDGRFQREPMPEGVIEVVADRPEPLPA